MANIIFISLIILFFLVRYWYNRTRRHRAYSNVCPQPKIDKTDIVFQGSAAGITVEQIRHILTKRHSYYRKLSEEEQQRFMARMLLFLDKKCFIIKDDKGVREMPVLVSAAAIQLTFGLQDYLLPFYKYIRIYPEEYFSDHSFAILAGNVQNNIITVAWSQLLQGFSKMADGSNVGLHEMGHALYIQKMVMDESYAKTFSAHYENLNAKCADASKTEVLGTKNLYSEFAETNLQEFWAETVELFFEKPNELYAGYPEVFEAVKLLLNQDPRNQQHPVIKTNRSLNERLKKISQFFTIRSLPKEISHLKTPGSV